MKYKEFYISHRLIATGKPPLLVSELSANHNGSLNLALELVQKAHESGADAIKLQTFEPDFLTLDSYRQEFYIRDKKSLWDGFRLYDLYRQAYTPREWHRPIFQLARSLGMICISSVFDEASVDYLLSIDVDALKVSSFELVHTPLLEKVGSTNKPVLLSTGMATLAEIDQAVGILRNKSCDKLILLKCTSAYPSSESDAHLRTMVEMAQRYCCPVGLSDHCLSPYPALTATALGAAVIEKHFTIDRRLGGLDSAFSLEPAEWRSMKEGVIKISESLGDIRYGPLKSEESSVWERPSVFVVEDIDKGEIFTTKNIRIIRPGHGIKPHKFRQVLGKRASKRILAGEPLTEDKISD